MKGAKAQTVSINTQTNLSSELSFTPRAFPLEKSNRKPEKDTYKGSNSQGTE